MLGENLCVQMFPHTCMCCHTYIVQWQFVFPVPESGPACDCKPSPLLACVKYCFDFFQFLIPESGPACPCSPSPLLAWVKKKSIKKVFLFWLLIPESGPAYPGGARLPHPFTQRAPASACVAAAVQWTSAYHGLPTDSYRGQHSDAEFPEVPLSQRSVADYLR